MNLTQKLLAYLREKGHITPGEFRLVFHAERLAPRVRELRKAGHIITTETATDFEGQRYTRYFLESARMRSAA